VNLRDIVRRQAKMTPDAPAVKDFNTCLTYGELDHMADRFARVLASYGICRGDRIGLWLEKTVYAVIAMQGILRLQAIYVPLDPLSPPARISEIIQDCRMKAVVTTQNRAEHVPSADLRPLHWLYLENIWSSSDELDLPAFSTTDFTENTASTENELAYILYTSGSTGKPKGVCISNRNALAFIEWATSVLEATSRDRFANHAPLHFDLSVLDLYVAFSVGAVVFLIHDTISYIPEKIVQCITQEELTVWYSVPSALILMIEQGGFLELPSLPLRAILFAGEPFPLQQLRRLYQRWPATRYLNLYGPTETNVCTFYEVTSLSEDQTVIPIGTACSGDRVWVQKEDGTVAQAGEVGELMVEGPTVMAGYWGQPEQGKKPYATGDFVRQQDDGNYVYLGRRDHLVKIRGHRIELAEIETILAQHPAVHEVAVVVVGQAMKARLIAFLVPVNKESKPSLLDIKQHCADHLPRYMIVNNIQFLPELPRTRNGKVDRLSLSKDLTDRQKGQDHAKR